MTKLVILALAGGAENHEENESAQRETWAARLPPGVEIFWIHCVESLVVSEVKFGERLINVAMEERYENLLAKTVAAMRIVLNEFNPDYILRTNTSSYLDSNALLNQIADFRGEPLYGGYIGRFKSQTTDGSITPEDFQFVSGAGIWMSNKLAREVSCIDVRRFEHLVDDVAIGAFFRERGVAITPLARVNVTDFEPVSYGLHTRVKHWRDDNVTLRRMYELDALYSSADYGQLERNFRAFERSELQRMRQYFEKRFDQYAMRAFGVLKSRSSRLKQFSNSLLQGENIERPVSEL